MRYRARLATVSLFNGLCLDHRVTPLSRPYFRLSPVERLFGLLLRLCSHEVNLAGARTVLPERVLIGGTESGGLGGIEVSLPSTLAIESATPGSRYGLAVSDSSVSASGVVWRTAAESSL